MALSSPLEPMHRKAEAQFLPYGPLPHAPAPAPAEGPEMQVPGPSTSLVATFGEIEAEYATIRKGAAILDTPHRGIIEVTGTDRVTFLEQMLSNRLTGIAAGDVVHAFWLNRKGRIVSDLTIVELGDRMLIDLDVLTVTATLTSLEQYLFSEDVSLRDRSAELHVLGVHGPKAAAVLASALAGAPGRATGQGEAARGAIEALAPGKAVAVAVEGEGTTTTVVYRDDVLGDPGLHMIAAADEIVQLHQRLVDQGEHAAVRPIGWLAANIARIEAGTPVFLLDFGPDSLPHETGILHQRVSFKKGCYLGQEVVARMESLGKPKKTLCGLKLKSDRMPGSGGQVYDPADTMGEVIGAVTSATPSPMLGNTIIAFAMLRHNRSQTGTPVVVNAEGEQVEAIVHPLQFWKREG